MCAVLVAIPSTGTALAGLHRAVGWTDGGVHVVGGPIAADGRVLVIVSDSDRSTWLEAISPTSGKALWRIPEGFSEIAAGVEVAPLARGHTALALVPSPSHDGTVRLEGVDISTGRVVWRSSGAQYVTDVPEPCPNPIGARAFCVVTAKPSAEPTLLAISPATGRSIATVQGIERTLGSGVFQAFIQPSVLVGIDIPGGFQWSTPVVSAFGPGYDPNFGWNFDTFGSVDAGWVGKQSGSGATDLGASKTVGLDDKTGRTLWVIHGSLECGGGSVFKLPFACALTGTLKVRFPKFVVSRNARGVIEGFSPRTGKISWRFSLDHTHLASVLTARLEIADETHLLVWSNRGERRVLDLKTGSSASPTVGQVFWCERQNVFRVKSPPKGVPPERMGVGYLSPCDINGKPAKAKIQPLRGVVPTVGGVIVWASSAGLEAAPSG